MRKEQKKDADPTADFVAEKDESVDVESLVASHYLVNERLGYNEIRQIMNLSRATVARRIQHAKRQGWLIEKPVLNIPLIYKDKFVSMIHDTELQKKLLSALKRYGLRSITVVSDKGAGSPKDHQVAKRVGQAAAARITAALANRDGLIGINWGHSMRQLVDHLPVADEENWNLEFIPLFGNLSVDEESEKAYEEALLCSSNRLTRRFAEAFKTKIPRTLTAPAIISRIFIDEAESLDIIWKLIEQDISYQRIFGVGHHSQRTVNHNALINKADTIVSGMSSLMPESALVSIANLVTPEELTILRDAGYVGDLGGHPIKDPDHENSNSDAKRIAESVSSLVVSATPNDFIKVAEKSRDEEDDDTGVFITGTGTQKAGAFLAAIKMRAVNELCTDRATAQEMADLLGLK